ncbi:PREDICTED: UPF0545 protein C22orf39 homolog [Amphimedon queenslandica]|uniref:Synaptic plasticity regulator PANTS n=1 Tax=Amphimedon queenslandica TaxID=400682 RepID=A0A1X7V9Q5_AMPQE|nr:PREDICTED: UPF0545 protein C22orf39 homolog [Amphimedon queenslandica]|eukprot:XP_003385190.1 PREDICTED: UPF0545 protein C22orf39 homolog [Amphimedon queenslandica]
MASEMKEETPSTSGSSDDSPYISSIPPDRRKQYEKMRCYEFIFATKQCLSSFHQFHKYYIYGQFDDCAIEKQRVKDCFKWRTSKSMEAKENLFKSLEAEQTNMHTPDPVWKYREKPPEDW